MKELIVLSSIEAMIEQEPLFRIERLSIKEFEVIGIVGRNGSGKSILLNLLNHQFKDFTGTMTEYVPMSSSSYVKQEVEEYEGEESVSFDFKHDDLAATWQKHLDFEKLSGGEKLKKRLGDSLREKKSLLYLDEPTNHLDEESVNKLISELKQYKGTLVIVSHDRYFLDELATTIWSFEDGEVKSYKGNYSKFVALRDLERETQQREYDKQQKEIRRVKKEMQQLQNWSTSAHAQSTKKEGFKEYYRTKAKRMDKQRKSVEKRLETQLTKENIEAVKDNHEVTFTMAPSKIKKGRVLLAENISKEFDGKVVLSKAGMTVMFGERIAITGANGSGKTTLLKMILGEESYDGSIWLSEFSDIGYLSQEVFDLPVDKRVSEYFDVNNEVLGKVMTLFIHLGFSRESWSELIGNLSMGERIKLKLMAHIIEQKNLLILDEPTNHLDIPSREELEKVLASYEGTIIFVSHDRYFREQIATKTMEIKETKLVSLMPIGKKEKPVDLLLLSMKKDALLSQLSLLATGSPEYEKANIEFQNVLNEIEVSKTKKL